MVLNPTAEVGSFAALEAVALRGAADGDELVRWLFLLPALRSVPRRVRDDVLQTVALALLASAPAIRCRLLATNPTLHPGPAADRIVRAYVAAMVRNCARDLQRRDRSADTPPSEPVDARHPELGLEIREVLGALEAAMELALDTSARGRRDALAQIRALARGEVDMQALVDQIAGRGADEDSRRRARDRVYKRHRRARTALVGALWQLAALGCIGREVAERAAAAVDDVFALR